MQLAEVDECLLKIAVPVYTTDACRAELLGATLSALIVSLLPG